MIERPPSKINDCWECPVCGALIRPKGYNSHYKRKHLGIRVLTTEHFKGRTPWNKGLTKETDTRVRSQSVAVSDRFLTTGGSFKNRNHSPETIAKIAISMLGNRNANHRGDRQSYYGDIRMDSRWEVLVATYLDRTGCIWLYSPEGFKLSNGRVLYPDFFLYNLDGSLDKIVEVKGFFREANKEKFALFLSEYPELTVELWDKKLLKEKGIL